MPPLNVTPTRSTHACSPISSTSSSTSSTALTVDNDHEIDHEIEQDHHAVIGICGGVGPAAGVMLHQIILHHTDNRGTDQGHLDVCHISRSSDTTDRTSYLLREKNFDMTNESRIFELENPAQGMLRTAHMVQDAIFSRRDTRVILGVPCNTFHAPPIWNQFHQELVSSPQVTILHMLNETIEMIQSMAPACTSVGLLSTTGTRASRVYHDLLKARDYDVVEVSEELQVELHETIYNPTWGIKGTSPAITPKAVSHFQKYATLLANQGAQVIIMGCTEIPFAFVGQDQIQGQVLLIDPMVALGRALIREACPSKLKPLLTQSKSKPIDAKKKNKTHTSVLHTREKPKPLTNIRHAQRRLSKISQRSRPRCPSFSQEEEENIDHEDAREERSEEPKMWRIWNFYSEYVNSILTPVHDDVY